MVFFRDRPLSRALTRFFGATQTVPSRQIKTPFQLQEYLDEQSEEGPISEDCAMRVAAVFACIRILSNSQAMLPLNLMKWKGDNASIDESHAVQRILQRPNRWQTAFEFESMMTAHRLLRGDAFAYKSILGGEIKELIPLNVTRMEVEQRSDLSIVYRYRTQAGTVRTFSQDQIHHRRGLTTDGIRGLSPLSAARSAIRLALQMEKHGAKLFSNAAKPSGALKTDKPLSAEAHKRLKESFEEQYAGTENAHKTLILEDGLSWEAIGMTAEDAQFIDSRKFSRNEIAMFYGVPPHMIGDIDRGTSWGSGIEQQSLGFLVHTLNPHLVNDTQALARDLLGEKERGKYFIAHDTGILTRAEFLTRQQGLEIQFKNGVINADEWRRIEGLNPRADGKGQEYISTPGADAQSTTPPGKGYGQQPQQDPGQQQAA